MPECTYRDIEVSGSKVRLNHEDVLIDLGSIAKGYIVDRIVEFLKGKPIYPMTGKTITMAAVTVRPRSILIFISVM